MQQAAETATKVLQTAASVCQDLWYDSAARAVGTGTLLSVLEDARAFDGVYANLADDGSRCIFDWFIRFRVAYALVGEDAYDLFPASESRATYAKRCASLRRSPTVGYVIGEWVIDSDAGAIVDSILLEQYCLRGLVEPSPDSTILDIGAYKGETAIWLASRAGAQGEVYAVEPDPSVIDTLRANIEGNRAATLAPIHLLPFGVGARPGRQCFSYAPGGSSRIDASGEITIDLTTIDVMVDQLGLGWVNFIKMDVEGGEVNALRGAESTLRRFAPSLAICVYHLPRDLPDITGLIRQAHPEYRLYLSHKSPTWPETVLFACVDARNVPSC
jgi:FkbM family methyltransferase